MCEYILLKLAIINFYENLRLPRFLVPGRSERHGEANTQISFARTQKLTHTNELYTKTIVFFLTLHGSETEGVFKQNPLGKYA